jgi:hypothetical protein
MGVFWGKKKGSKVVSLFFFEENKSEDNEFLEVVKTILLGWQTSTQIWLTPLVYDLPVTYFDQVFFISKICEVGGLAIICKGLGQIWVLRS